MAEEKKHIVRSELTHILNHKTPNAIRWCTPSIDLNSHQVKNPYLSDTSISYQSLGYPSEPSGIFKEIYDQAAKAYNADHTLFSVNGSTGSNFIVLRSLSKQIPNLRILAQRNIHKSVISACEDYGINLMFLPITVDEEVQIFLPNTEDEIIKGIKKTKPQVLLLTNPTYEGMTIDLKTLIPHIKNKFPEIIIFIEEAWGAHLHFSKKLPISAMDAGADICVQSTHKQGGALQQGGMIHWKDGKINSELLMNSYQSLLTTSPSFLLLASLDAARVMMENQGEEKIDHLLSIAKRLEEELDGIDGLDVLTTAKLKKRDPSMYARDESKVIINVGASGYSGFDFAKQLENKYKIIVEEYNMNTILLLVPFRATHKDVDKTVAAFKEIMHTYHAEKKLAQFNLKIPMNIPKVLELRDVTNLLWNQIELVSLDRAEGRIAAEYITPFPPGIPLTIKGEELTHEIVEYYKGLKIYPNAHVSAQDKSLETVWVVK
jgi:lysine decarboxylase